MMKSKSTKQKQKISSKKSIRKKSQNNKLILENHLSFKGFKGNFLIIDCKGTSQYMAILKVSGIDTTSLSQDDISAAFSSFANATMQLRLPHKYVFTTGKPILSSQLEYLRYKKDHCINSYSSMLIEREITRLDSFSKNRLERRAYLFVYSDNSSNLTRAVSRYVSTMKQITNVSVITPNDTIDLMHSHLCFTESSPEEYNDLNEAILPSSISISNDSYKIGNVYIGNLILNGYPNYVTDWLLADRVCNRYTDCVVMMDVDTTKREQTINSIKQAMKELDGRRAIKQSYSDQFDNEAELEDMNNLYNMLTRGQEQMLTITIRIIVKAESQKALEERIAEIKDDLSDSNIISFRRTNEMLDEYLGLVLSADYIKSSIPLHSTYARQFPFYDETLLDANGVYFGDSQSGGIVAIDFFNRTSGRNSYDILAVGMKGSGKTILTKSIVQQRVMLGDKVLVLDAEGEYKGLVEVLGGQTIRFTSKSRINPLQLSDVTVGEDNNGVEDVEDNFTREIGRIVTFIGEYSPAISDDAKELFKRVILSVFNNFGIDTTADISALCPADFPVFNDVLAELNRRLYDNHGAFRDGLSSSDIEAYRELIRVVENLSTSPMFGGATNIEVTDSNLIVFDVKSISEMDAHTFDAQLFNIVSVMWSEVCKNARHNQTIDKSYDRRRVMCVIEEAHTFVNANKAEVTDFIVKLMRRSRKYDASLFLSSQHVNDFCPEEAELSGVSAVKKVFTLAQYKIIMKQESASFKRLQELFYQLTEHEVKNTAGFSPGDMILCLGDGRYKIHCHRNVDTGDLLYMGNSQDVQEIILSIFNELYSNVDSETVIKELSRDSTKFERIFKQEVYEYIGCAEGISHPLDDIISNAIIRLVKSLIGGVRR